MEKKLLKPEELEERYGISKWTAYLWALQGKIPSLKIGRLRRFPLKELDKIFGVNEDEISSKQFDSRNKNNLEEK